MLGFLGAASGAGGGAGYSSSQTDETSIAQRAANNIGGISFGANNSQPMWIVGGIAAAALLVAAFALRGRR